MADAADVELLWPYIAIAQLYAFHQSRTLGLSPDNPNKEGTVNRVVQGVRLYRAGEMTDGYFLGVDGGGTKTRFALIDADAQADRRSAAGH